MKNCNQHMAVMLTAAVILPLWSMGQLNTSSQYRNALQTRICGNGGYISFNYERHLLEEKRHNATISAGLGFDPYTFVRPYDLFVPFTMNYLYGRIHLMKIGYAPSIVRIGDNLLGDQGIYRSIWQVYHFADVGYRFNRKNNKIYAGLSWTPSISVYEGFFDIKPFWGSAEIGYKF